MKISVSGEVSRKSGFSKVVLNEKIVESRLILDKSGGQTLEIKPFFKEKANRRHLVILARQIVFFAKKYGIKKIFLDCKTIENINCGCLLEEAAEILAVNFEMANYEFVRYKTPPKEGWNFAEEIILFCEKEKKITVEKFVKKGQLIGKEVNASRELSNTPGGEMTPKLMAEEAKKAVKGTSVRVKILEEKELKKLGMGAVLGVSKGSCEKPRFIVLEYGSGRKEKPIVFIGKAITFDTGGLSLKPSDSMADMQMDMSGGAAVIHAIVAAAKIGIKRRIVGLIPAAENMPSGESYRPGDILKSMSGQTIEVLNTDAEGRIILADALTYAEKYKPELVVDVATLTGASLLALGERASAILSKDEELMDIFRDLGERSGDYVWPLPLWDEYETEIKGINGDWANIRSQGNSRYGGTITGAMFLYQFAKKFDKWVHIDMAPKTTAVFDEFLAKGSAGSPVRLLVKLLEEYK